MEKCGDCIHFKKVPRLLMGICTFLKIYTHADSIKASLCPYYEEKVIE
jgi:hypothetical protein